MNSIERRKLILEELKQSNNALKGVFLANKYNVTRQIIVKDIAILRASGNLIIATPDGYIAGTESNGIKRIIAVSHKDDRLEEELQIIIKYGGIVEDVIVEHPIYGEIKGMLMIKNFHDLENFLNKYKSDNTKLLSILTNGIHIHTIAADNEESMKLIINELNQKGFIIE